MKENILLLARSELYHHHLGKIPVPTSAVNRLCMLLAQVLPVIGLLLQAPFESNENFKSFLALSRWIGNPIASISYVLWNIKVSGKCAMMVDMATQYDEFPGADSQFGQMRDSLYILSVMNQCKSSFQPSDCRLIGRC